MTARYECPDHDKAAQDIHKRYKDTSLVIFKEQQNRPLLRNYLSFGPSRKTMEYSSNGNDAVVVKKPGKPARRTVATINVPLKQNSACSII